MNAFTESGLEYLALPAGFEEFSSAVNDCAALKQIVFTGDFLETLNEWTFQGVTAVAYYPADNGTWTEDKLLDYGGDLTWVPYTEIPAYNPFDDVEFDAFYYDAVLWAVGEGITNGYGSDETFAPMQGCTREQVVTFLWRSAGKPAPTSNENPFSDVEDGKWYTDAILWAVEKGITTGYLDTDLFGTGNECTRAQIVTFLHRYAGEPAPVSGENPFEDMTEADWFYYPVLWAVEEGITNGYGSDTIFNPEGICTRGQIVTFLYRSRG